MCIHHAQIITLQCFFSCRDAEGEEMQKTKRKKKQYGKTKKKQVKRTIKDSLFRFLFEKDKEIPLVKLNIMLF